MSKKNRIKLDIDLNINDIVEVSATSYTHEGMGVCRYKNVPIFVSKMLVGETGRVMIKQIKPNYLIGVLVTLLEKSPQRIQSDCIHYNMCGGCSLRHMNANEQNSFKVNLIKSNLLKYAGIDIAKISVVPSPSRNYRNKASFVAGSKNGKLFLGFYKKNTHEVIEIEHCLINNDFDYLKKFCENILNELKETAYDEVSDLGNIKHVILRKTNIGEIQITLVTKEQELKKEELFIEKMTKRFPNIKSIIVNHKPYPSNTILGKHQRVLFGDSFICDEINGLRFKIGSQSFYQVNYDVMKEIYNYAINNLNLTPQDVLLDAFCGLGTISLLSAKLVKEVIGIEYNKQAVDLANANRKLNNIENVKFHSGLVENVVVNKNIKFNKLIVDPARKGCDAKFLT